MSECKKCGGTKVWQYDHNHGQPCPDCCKHDQGWWDVSKEHHGSSYIEGGDNGCCIAGCGTMRRDLKENNNE